MKATCPKDPTHKRFVTVAYVSEDWVVDETGEFVEMPRAGFDQQVLHNPDPDNIWTCYTCGAEATVT